MASNKIIRRILLFFWAAILMHVAAGSLINFHQHKIWHKELLPQYFVTSRDKAKAVKILNLKNGQKILTDPHSGYDLFITGSERSLLEEGPCVNLLSSADPEALPGYSPGGNGLRAPPAI